MSYYYSRKTNIPFHDAVTRIIDSLQQHGFGVITTIDLKETLKQKLNINFRPYKIIGACNPEFAFKVVSIESHAGLLLPCNLVVQEHENAEVEVSAINPLYTIDRTTVSNQLTEIANEVGSRLRAVIDDLRPGITNSENPEVLSTTHHDENMSTPMQG